MEPDLEKGIDLTKVPVELKEQWVAIGENDEVIAAASTLKEVKQLAEARTREDFLVTVTGSFQGAYLL